MKNLKIGIMLFGAVGLVGMFMSEIGLRFQYDKVNTIIVLAAFAIPTILAVMALAKPPFQMWQAGVSLACFALVVVKTRMWKVIPDIVSAGLGHKFIMIGTVGGVIVSILLLAKPEDQA